MSINKALAASLLLSVCNTFCQGTMLFHTYLDSTQAVPPNSSARTATGEFYLYLDSNFTGAIFIPSYDGITSVSLFRATSSSDLGVNLFQMAPGPIEFPRPDGSGGGQNYEFDTPIPLSSNEANDLRSGLWWVSVVTPQYPNGEIRGQITAVPEPSTTALFIVEAGIVGLVRRRRDEKTSAE